MPNIIIDFDNGQITFTADESTVGEGGVSTTSAIESIISAEIDVSDISIVYEGERIEMSELLFGSDDDLEEDGEEKEVEDSSKKGDEDE